MVSPHDLVPLRQYVEESNGLFSITRIKRMVRDQRRWGCQGVFYQLTPRGPIFVHRQRMEEWLAGRVVRAETG